MWTIIERKKPPSSFWHRKLASPIATGVGRVEDHCIAFQSLDIRAMRWQAALHQFQKLPDFAAMNNEHGWPSGLALASSDNQPISINGAPPISIDGHGPCPSVHAMQVATQNSTGVSKGSFSARSDPQMRPGARDSWSGPCALLRLHGSAGLAHHTKAGCHSRLARSRARPPASPTRCVQSPRRFFLERPGIQATESRW